MTNDRLNVLVPLVVLVGESAHLHMICVDCPFTLEWIINTRRTVVNHLEFCQHLLKDGANDMVCYTLPLRPATPSIPFPSWKECILIVEALKSLANPSRLFSRIALSISSVRINSGFVSMPAVAVIALKNSAQPVLPLPRCGVPKNMIPKVAGKMGWPITLYSAPLDRMRT